MVLRPSEEDGYLRSEAANPIFSVAHRSVARGIEYAVSPLQEELLRAYSPLSYEDCDLKAHVIQRTLTQLGIGPRQVPCDFEALKQSLQREVNALPGISVDFSKTAEGTPITQEFIDNALLFEAQTTTPTDYIEALLSYSARGLFETMVESPFNSLITPESWSIATQFLLGITNIYCVTQGKISPDTNWGHILDSNSDLSKSLAQTLAEAQKERDDIEKICLSWINAHATELKLKTTLTPADFKAVKETFAERYAEIKDSPHFDEFFL